MAGHSHWAQIKHKKSLTDKKRSQLIAKLVNLIITAGKDNPNPESNPKLKSAIERAKEHGVSQEVIERNLKKLKNNDYQNLEELFLEAYGPAGVGLIIKCLTNNKIRTVNEIKNILTRHKAKLAEPGSVMWMFEERGVVTLNKDNVSEYLLNDLGDLLLDFKEKEEKILFYTNITDVNKIREILQQRNFPILSTEIQLVPKIYVNIEYEKDKQDFDVLINELLEHNDVYEVYSNNE
jgi:YebC/PmpR family DNA-binding regulatory protein